MPGKPIHEPKRTVFSCRVRVISWTVLAAGKDNTKPKLALLFAVHFLSLPQPRGMLITNDRRQQNQNQAAASHG